MSLEQQSSSVCPCACVFGIVWSSFKGKYLRTAGTVRRGCVSGGLILCEAKNVNSTSRDHRSDEAKRMLCVYLHYVRTISFLLLFRKEFCGTLGHSLNHISSAASYLWLCGSAT